MRIVHIVNVYKYFSYRFVLVGTWWTTNAWSPADSTETMGMFPLLRQFHATLYTLFVGPMPRSDMTDGFYMILVSIFDTDYHAYFITIAAG